MRISRVLLVVSAVFFCLLSIGCGGASGAGSSGGGGGTGSTSGGATGPTPTVTSITPSKIDAGSASTTLTVKGTNFVSASAVQVGTVLLQTTYVSSTQLTATIQPGQIANGATLPVIVISPGGNNTASGSVVNLEVDNPAPAITSFAPSSFVAGAAPASVAVAGTGFVPSTSIQVSGAARPTTFVSATQVNFVPSVGDIAAAGAVSITAVNPAPGGGTSAAASLAVVNAAPAIASFSPSFVTLNGGAQTIQILGSNFVEGATVTVNGASRTATFNNPSSLAVALLAGDAAVSGSLRVTVTNPASAGGGSASANIVVGSSSSTPVISTISPSSAIVGSPGITISVLASSIKAGCAVQWNGTNLTTNYVTSSYSGSYLIAAVSASLLSSVGTADITVSCPTAPAASAAKQFNITNPPVPTLSSLSPGGGPVNTAQQVTVYGTGFTTNSVVQVDGTAVPTTFNSSTTLTAQVPANSFPVLGNYNITVYTPAPGGGTSSAISFTTYVGIPNNSMVYNSVNGLFYVSVPSSAGAPYGNSVVSVDPLTGALGTPILVGSEPDRMALTSDGKYLWVALDGASAVRKVDLTTGTAGLQFTLGGNAGVYAGPGTVYAMAALPGATDSVVVASSGSYSTPTIAIFDSGVRRGAATPGYYNGAYALAVDGTRHEIYTAGSSVYNVYTYDASGVTLKTTMSSTASASYTSDNLQLADGRAYTDSARVVDAESGALLGTLYSSGTNLAIGPTVADTALSKIFVLDSAQQYSSSYTQIQIFNSADFTTSASSIPISAPSNSSTYSNNAGPSRLTRWGTNGLAFRTNIGVFSVRSNLVKDLSSVVADMGVTLSASGATTTGSTGTWTATVKNKGTSGATDARIVIAPPSTGVLTSLTASQGSCSLSAMACSLGALANNGTATVTANVQFLQSGSATLSATVSASETDNSTTDNSASSAVTVTGSAYNPAPAVASITPNAVASGSSDTTITINGSGFTGGSVVQWNGSSLATSYTNAGQLTAIVPAANLASLGYGAITVSNNAPGGGVSAPQALSVFNVLTVGLNHIVYDPFTRKLYASVGSGSSTVTGNSIVAITPETGNISDPVTVGSQPTTLALSDNGKALYAVLSGATSIARYDMSTQKLDFTIPISSYGSNVPRGLAVQPGNENVLAVDISAWNGVAIYDVNTTPKTGTIRGAATGPYSGASLQFLDTTNLYGVDSDTSGATFNHYTVTSSGFTYYNYQQFKESTLNHFGPFKIRGGLAFANAGGVANPATDPATQLGVFTRPDQTYTYYQTVEPDPSLKRVFYLSSGSYSSPDTITAFDTNSFLMTGKINIPFSTIEGTSSSSGGADLIRWGQDGLAALTTGGHLYLIRGGAVVPQLMSSNTAAAITSLSSTSAAHGASNMVITVTGSNFVPGAAVLWNGNYRTSTIVDATHINVAIPASDLATAGTASISVQNPNATASGTLTFTIN